jgi:hypothetical protein
MNKILHLYPAPQHVVPTHAALVTLEAILAALAGDLCKILQANFGEFPFHALG